MADASVVSLWGTVCVPSACWSTPCVCVYVCVCVHARAHAQPCLTLCDPWTLAHQVPLFMGFPRQEHWSELPFPSFSRGSSRPRDWTRVSCTSCRWILYYCTAYLNAHSVLNSHIQKIQNQQQPSSARCSRLPHSESVALGFKPSRVCAFKVCLVLSGEGDQVKHRCVESDESLPLRVTTG